tara:strand:+ start:2308 stop:2466 length:159 start_codon:yes stop_codon:yes gene_type:complete
MGFFKKKKVPTNIRWDFETQRKREARKEIVEILTVIAFIPIFYYMAVLLLTL